MKRIINIVLISVLACSCENDDSISDDENSSALNSLEQQMNVLRTWMDMNLNPIMFSLTTLKVVN